ncbi:hypothetical protein [Francisella sp. TX07-6608]|uniref:hypothetical protein n=1 Tax=Francisella sp. TX07-6608 TaxID=573568 RepID=UPI0008F9DAC1|nr:hypothetical protein [Francisella sp. TX07-6608]
MKKISLVSLILISAISATYADQSTLDKVGDKLNDTGDAIKTSTQNAYYNVKDAVTPNSSDEMTSAAQEARKGANQTANTVGDKLSDAGSAIKTSAQKAYYNAKDAVTPDASDELASAAQEARKGANQTAISAQDKVQETAKNIKSTTAEKLQDASDAIEEGFVS